MDSTFFLFVSLWCGNWPSPAVQSARPHQYGSWSPWLMEVWKAISDQWGDGVKLTVSTTEGPEGWSTVRPPWWMIHYRSLHRTLPSRQSRQDETGGWGWGGATWSRGAGGLKIRMNEWNVPQQVQEEESTWCERINKDQGTISTKDLLQSRMIRSTHSIRWGGSRPPGVLVLLQTSSMDRWTLKVRTDHPLHKLRMCNPL